MKRMGSLAALAVLTAAGTAGAYTVVLNDFSKTGPYTDTRSLGDAVAYPSPNLPASPDGNGSVKLTSVNGTDSQEKVAPVFYNGTLGPALGTLGDLSRGGFSLDWYLELRDYPATTPSYVYTMAAVILTVDGPQGSPPGSTASLYWETAYQGTPPVYSQGQWYNDINLGSGNFWEYYGGTGAPSGVYGQAGTPTLTQWASGSAINSGWPVFDQNTKVYGVTVSIGSGAGNYTAYVDDIKLTFTAIPEPGTVALLSAGGLLILRRRREA